MTAVKVKLAFLAMCVMHESIIVELKDTHAPDSPKVLLEKEELFITGDVDDVAIIIYDFACRMSN